MPFLPPLLSCAQNPSSGTMFDQVGFVVAHTMGSAGGGDRHWQNSASDVAFGGVRMQEQANVDMAT